MMNYLYDVLLNWSDTDYIYDFYEWDTNDLIEIVKKIPVFRIEREKYSEIKKMNSTVTKQFLDSIYQKTTIQSERKIKRIDYSCILFDGYEAIAYEFDENGNVLLRSTILFNDLKYIYEMDPSEYNIEIIYKHNNVIVEEIGLTRLERDKKSLILLELDKMFALKQNKILSYIYSELFDENGNDIEKMYDRINNYIKNGWNKYHEKVYEIISLLLFQK